MEQALTDYFNKKVEGACAGQYYYLRFPEGMNYGIFSLVEFLAPDFIEENRDEFREFIKENKPFIIPFKSHALAKAHPHDPGINMHIMALRNEFPFLEDQANKSFKQLDWTPV